MENEYDITVIICTYNRCDLLSEALESVLSQDADEIRYELIVVDNNSTDDTKSVIASFLSRGYPNFRFLFEGKQGLSNARNAGLANARAPLIAFTDDDVRVARDWVRAIKRTFDEHPEVDYLGGKVLPRWNVEPPPWLTGEHWSALALQDHGETSFYSNDARPTCLVSANLALRRELLPLVGNFDPAFARIGASSSEDHEWQLRVWNSGRQGLYAPQVVVTADVQVERMSKAYHRLWHTGHGVSCAMMRDPVIERGSARLFGVPAPLFREAARHALGLVKHTVRRDEASALISEVYLRWFRSFYRHRRADYLATHQGGTITEVATFVTSLVSAKIRSRPA